MDKYEYRLKAEQIEKLVKRQDYETAAQIADTIDWRRVKNLNILNIVSEIYEKTERYEDCMEILNIAYDRAPVGRMILYKMTEISTRMHNFEEAISLYREFVRTAPHDQSRYILKYLIYRERGSSVEDQIKILSEYKTHEYQEKWAYELAALYAKAGMIEDCIRECDELVLWFSEGEYVIKALELKMQYEPLTASQQEKYDHRMDPEGAHPHEDDFDETEVPEFNADRFSTINLQAELAANLDELLNEDEDIDLPNFNMKSVGTTEELNTLAVTREMAKPDPDMTRTAAIRTLDVLEVAGEGAENADSAARREKEPESTPKEAPADRIEFEELGFEELTVGEFEVTEASPDEEEQAAGSGETAPQPKIKAEPETETKAVPEAKAEEKPAAPKKESGGIELPDNDIPEIIVQKVHTPRSERVKGQAGKNVTGAFTSEIEIPGLDDLLSQVPPKEEVSEPEHPVEKQITGQMTIDDILAEWENKKAKTQAILEANAKENEERRERVKQETAELVRLISGNSEDIPKDVRQIMDEIDEENRAREEQKQEEPLVTEDDLPPDLDEENEAEIPFEELIEPVIQPLEPKKPERVTTDTVAMNMIQELGLSVNRESPDTAVNAGHLTKEQARLFAYFTSVRGMSQQLSVLFRGKPKTDRANSSGGNLVVTGTPGNGKTTLAIDIVKAMQKQNRVEGRKLAKISGRKLNTKDVQGVLGKLKGGALIIEGAGGLADDTVIALSLAMEGDTGGLVVILEDSAEEIAALFRKNKNFASKFDHTIDIPIFSNDELVAFGRSYALEQDYVIDEFGALALYDCIGRRQTNDHLVTVAEVKDLVDAAVEHAEKGSIRHLFEKVTKRSTDEYGNHLLREEDFTE